MKQLTFGLFLIVALTSWLSAADNTKTAYDFSFKPLIGETPIPLLQWKG